MNKREKKEGGERAKEKKIVARVQLLFNHQLINKNSMM